MQNKYNYNDKIEKKKKERRKKNKGVLYLGEPATLE